MRRDSYVKLLAASQPFELVVDRHRVKCGNHLSRLAELRHNDAVTLRRVVVVHTT